ncbi:hypothetical protein [Clostridium gasigenes]|uniref:Uncharacterized protein n=1 Tax=Clostridium gasigenes TaxID=94869 RepID=A0A1H0MDF3_9CLOT|nr:hypothetical protein [Clostridium gasigenes]MBB6713735.1 hypothetical protein [Clostridium gasigenes]SDO78361.1 hypothetical protein SAMN04488529_101416 [Clostridium gasigenes]
MILYHATSKENKEKILEEWFKTSKGRWKENQWIGRYFIDNVFGEGVYFATTEKNTIDDGEIVIKCELNNEYIVKKFIISNDGNSYKKIDDIKYTSKKNCYKAISIHFKDGNYTEVVVYEPSIIEIVRE